MKNWLGILVAVMGAGALAGACSDDDNGAPAAGTGGTGGARAGSGGMGGSTMPRAGSGGTAGSTGAALNLGTPVTLTSPTSVTAPTYSIDGNFSTTNSTLGTTITIDTARSSGRICVSGTVGQVQNGADGNADYGNYWGAELVLTLRQGGGAPAPTGDAGAPASDAGAADAGVTPVVDASVPVADAGDVAADAGAPPAGGGALPWERGNVIGFAYTLEGPMVLANMRFKAQPTGTDPAADNFCYGIAPVGGARTTTRFDQITRDCWNAGGMTMPAGALNTISWQLPADTNASYPFDFCLTNLTPILAN